MTSYVKLLGSIFISLIPLTNFSTISPNEDFPFTDCVGEPANPFENYQQESIVLNDFESKAELSFDEEGISSDVEMLRGQVRDTSTINGFIAWTDYLSNIHKVPNIRVDIYIGNGLILPPTVTDSISTNRLGTYSYSFTCFETTRVKVEFYSEALGMIVRGRAESEPYMLYSEIKSVEPSTDVNIRHTALFPGFGTTAVGTMTYQVLHVIHALVFSSWYAYTLSGEYYTLTTIYPSVDIYGNPTGTYYQPNSIHSNRRIFVAQVRYRSFDSVMHEYGHFFQDIHDLDNSPGGSHDFSPSIYDQPVGGALLRSKDACLRLAWGEGWATFFAFAAQHELTTAEKDNIPLIDNNHYNHATYTYQSAYLSSSYYVESPNHFYGEANEGTIISVLWDLYDEYDAVEPADISCISFVTLLEIAKSGLDTDLGHAAYTISEFIELFRLNYEGVNIDDYLLSNILQINGFLPIVYNPLEEEVYSQYFTITWQIFNGGSDRYPYNQYVIEFAVTPYFNDTIVYSSVVNPTVISNRNTYTLTASDWSNIRLATSSNDLYWRIKISQSDSPITGPYITISHLTSIVL